MERLTQRFDDGEAFCGEFAVVDNVGVNETCLTGKLIDKLAEYEDLEEQGLLLKLPCSIGSDVYFIPSKVNYDINKLNCHEENNRVYHQKVKRIVFTQHGWYLECDKDLTYGTGNVLVDVFIKKDGSFRKLKPRKP